MVTILGTTGFVGSALVRYLEGKGEDLTLLDMPHFDLTCPETYNQIPRESDILIHAAGYVGSASQDSILWKTNVESTYYLIRYLNASCRPHLVIYLSTGAVYGMQLDAVTCDSSLRPVGLYAVSKLLSERMFETLLDCDLVILRLFFPFGPGQQPPRLIPRLIHQIARDQPLEINTTQGLPFINPIFIDELVRQISQIMHEPKRTYYNLGGPNAWSIRQIAEALAQLLGQQPKFMVKNTASGNMMCKPDLPTSTQTTFEQHLAETVRRADYL